MGKQLTNRQKQAQPITKERMRSLKQFRDLPEAEFEEYWTKRELKFYQDNNWEARISARMEAYEEAYDLESLMPNDMSTLRALVQAQMRLDDFESEINKLSTPNQENPEESISETNLYKIQKFSEMCNNLRKDIGNMQDTLKISRRIRKSEQEESTVKFIESLKEKAKKFAEQKMHLVFCPKCHTLLAQIWWLYPDAKGNKIILHCYRELEGVKCDGEVALSAKELTSMGGRNYDNIPDSIK